MASRDGTSGWWCSFNVNLITTFCGSHYKFYVDGSDFDWTIPSCPLFRIWR